LPTSVPRDTPARRAFDQLVAQARMGDLTLLCWCAPRACHADILKARIETILEG